MSFYALPFGHAEWRVDRRNPKPKRRRGDRYAATRR